jgi:hypothetical protein
MELTIQKKQDSSKLQAYLKCPRQYLFKYVLGYKQKELSHDLIFGAAFHKAKEVLLQKGYSQQGIEAAYTAFLEAYRPYYGIETDEFYDPKSPQKVELALYKYVLEYANDKLTLMETEIGFTCLINEDKLLYGRLDALIEKNGLIYVLETKTSKALWSYWDDQWLQKLQISAYTHTLYSFYSPDKVGGVIIDGTIFKKKKGEEIEHRRVSIPKSGLDMLAWLDDINALYLQIDNDFEELEKSTLDQPYLKCFRKNTESCIQYNRLCEFHDLCIYRPNPLAKKDYVPQGYIIELWDPTKQPVIKTLKTP